MKPRVFCTRKIHPEALQMLASQVELEVWQADEPPSHAVLVQKASNLDGLLTLLSDPIDADVISSLPSSFKAISQMAVGFDNINITAATQRKFPVGHTPGVLTETCADFTWALMLSAARRVVEANREVMEGIWKPWGPFVLCGTDVCGATLGIIGFGRIGQAVARRAQGFNMRVLYFSPHRNLEAERATGAIYSPLDDLLAQSDFISLHANLNPQTVHLIGREQFEKMKPSAIFVNISRGAMVDPDVFLWALENHKVSAIAVDVFDPEPIPAGHPLLNRPDFLITPHIASASTQTRAKMAQITVDNLLAGVRGERMRYCANPQVYEG